MWTACTARWRFAHQHAASDVCPSDALLSAALGEIQPLAAGRRRPRGQRRGNAPWLQSVAWIAWPRALFGWASCVTSSPPRRSMHSSVSSTVLTLTSSAEMGPYRETTRQQNKYPRHQLSLSLLCSVARAPGRIQPSSLPLEPPCIPSPLGHR